MNRIAALPRRDWTVGAEQIADTMTAMLRSPYGTERLRPIQAVGLLEASELGGLVANARVGAGKTLLSGLLPVVMGSARPLLLVPGALVEKTLREFSRLRDHWQIPNQLRIESYSKLGLSKHENLLWAYRPDLIIGDEGQKLKHVTDSAVARRIARYLSEFPETKMCVMSGTLTKGSVLDYAHILVWCLGQGAPVPIGRGDQEEWAGALDPKAARISPEPLIPALGPSVMNGIEAAREAYRDRLRSTPGVLVSVDSYTGSSLSIEPIELDPPAKLSGPFEDLRTLWIAPDGWVLADARFEVWAVARQLGLGFYYRHDPWPPEAWFEARKRYCKMVRTVLEGSDRLDSELQVSQACEANSLPPAAIKIWQEWREIAPTFKINKVPEWLSDHAIEAAEDWGSRGPGIIWTEHRAFAQRLAKRTGWPVFGSRGVDAEGRSIESVKSEPIIASLKANGTGRNLQQFRRNLFVSPPTTGLEWEQGLGRTHRENQKADNVEARYFVGCYEHITAIENALLEASYTFETTGQSQKLLDANVQTPRGLGSLHPAWQATSKGV